MKSLKPSARENKRYLLVRGKNLKKNIPEALHDFIGTLGMSKTSLTFIDSKGDSAVISINRSMINEVRAGLCIHKEKMSVEKVSGTLKSLRS